MADPVKKQSEPIRRRVRPRFPQSAPTVAAAPLRGTGSVPPSAPPRRARNHAPRRGQTFVCHWRVSFAAPPANRDARTIRQVCRTGPGILTRIARNARGTKPQFQVPGSPVPGSGVPVFPVRCSEFVRPSSCVPSSCVPSSSFRVRCSEFAVPSSSFRVRRSECEVRRSECVVPRSCVPRSRGSEFRAFRVRVFPVRVLPVPVSPVHVFGVRVLRGSRTPNSELLTVNSERRTREPGTRNRGEV